MRAPSPAVRALRAGAIGTILALLLPLTALAKEGGLVTLAAPIPRDAEPGSSLTVTFTVTVPDQTGHMVPFFGSPMVLKLIGPDGTTTEAMGAERGTPGTYTATIRVPSSGISSAIFGIRGTGVAADETTSVQDLAFDVDGLLFTTTAHPAPAANAGTRDATGTTSTVPDYRTPIVAGLLAVAVAGLGAAVLIGRRRTLRSA
jgi:hypothetical protein